jgi:hypothetical protein
MPKRVWFAAAQYISGGPFDDRLKGLDNLIGSDGASYLDAATGVTASLANLSARSRPSRFVRCYGLIVGVVIETACQPMKREQRRSLADRNGKLALCGSEQPGSQCGKWARCLPAAQCRDQDMAQSLARRSGLDMEEAIA